MGKEQEITRSYIETYGEKTYQKLIKFKDELVKWNKKFSLTSVPDDQIFDKLIAPSAWLGREYARESVGIVADYGTGPGIPGAVMAIVDKKNQYSLYDSNQKKIGFIRHCLSIPEITDKNDAKAFALRVTPELQIEPVDRLVTRATGDMKQVIGLWQGKVRQGGVADFFKGEDAEEEIEALIKSYPAATHQILESPHWFGKLRIVRIGSVF